MSTEDDTTRKAKRAARNKAWREANKERLKAYTAGRRRERAAITEAYRQRHPERVAAYKERTKPQMAEYQAAYYEENKERIDTRIAAHYEANKTQINEQRREEYHRTPLKQKSRALLKRYGLSIEQYTEMLRSCDERCQSCKTPFSAIFHERPNVDHCHKSNRVRGLICHRCNIALGHTGDDPKILRALARYLERSNE